jgi:hypothetical protein
MAEIPTEIVHVPPVEKASFLSRLSPRAIKAACIAGGAALALGGVAVLSKIASTDETDDDFDPEFNDPDA